MWIADKNIFKIIANSNYTKELMQASLNIKSELIDIIHPGIDVYEDFISEEDKQNVKHIIRGLRNPADFEFEKKIALFNNSLEDIETIFFLTSPNNAFISSSIVREIIENDGDYKKYVPKSVTI